MGSVLNDHPPPFAARLLDLKINAPEIREIPSVNAINHYLGENIEAVKA